MPPILGPVITHGIKNIKQNALKTYAFQTRSGELKLVLSRSAEGIKAQLVWRKQDEGQMLLSGGIEGRDCVDYILEEWRCASEEEALVKAREHVSTKYGVHEPPTLADQADE